MMKKVLAMLITLTMLFSCIVTSVSVSAAEDVNLYNPRDLTLTAAKLSDDSNRSAVLAWKNPTSTSLQKVTVKSLNDNSTYTVDSPEAGKVSSVVVNGLAGYYGQTSFELVFDFEGGKKTQMFYNNRFLTSAGDDVFTPNGVKVMWTQAAGGYPAEFNLSTMVGTNHTIDGNKALKVTSNITSEQAQGRVFLNGYTLTAETEYNYSFWAYAPNGDADMTIVADGMVGTGDTNITISKSSEWQKIEGSYKTAASGSNGHFRLCMKTPAEAFYIDDIVISKKNESDSWTMDFETKIKEDSEYSTPTTVSAEAGDGAVTFSWSGHNTTATRFINVYDVTDGGRVLKSRTDQNASGVTLSYLENGKTYTFEITGMALCGYEAAAKTVTVTPQRSLIAKYDYEPGNIMITGWRENVTFADENVKGASMLSWKNPSSEKLNSVKVYRMNDNGTENDVTSLAKAHYGNENAYAELTKSGAVVRLIEGHNAVSGNVKYRLEFGFSDGEQRSVIYADAYSQVTSGFELSQTQSEKKSLASYQGMSYGTYANTSGGYGTMKSAANVKLSSEKSVSGLASLEFATNAWVPVYNAQNSAWTNLNENNEYINIEFGSYEAIQNVQCTVKMKVNTIEEKSIYIAGKTVKLPNTNGQWQSVEYNITPSDRNLTIKVACTTGACREFYIDDFEISANGTTVYSDDFERDSIATLRDALDVTTEAKNGAVAMTWEAGADSYVNVYEETDDGDYMLRAHVLAADCGVVISGLENDVEHNFMIKGVRAERGTFAGFEGNAALVSATPVAPDFEVTDMSLLSGTEKAESIEKGGAYTASAKVVNNKVTAGFKAQLIACVYANGVLEGCYVSTPETVTKGNNKTLTVDSFTVGNKDAVYTAKLMLWKGLDSASPIVQAIPYAQAAVSAE